MCPEVGVNNKSIKFIIDTQILGNAPKGLKNTIQTCQKITKSKLPINQTTLQNVTCQALALQVHLQTQWPGAQQVPLTLSYSLAWGSGMIPQDPFCELRELTETKGLQSGGLYLCCPKPNSSLPT